MKLQTCIETHKLFTVHFESTRYFAIEVIAENKQKAIQQVSNNLDTYLSSEEDEHFETIYDCTENY